MLKEWLILAIVGGGLGFWYSIRRPGTTWLDHLVAIVLPVLAVALGFIYLETVLLNTRWPWSACRLAPALAWLHGYPLYSPVDTGVINGWLYGPVAAVLWLPAALAGSPQSALVVAAIINVGFLLVPLWFAARASVPESRWRAGLVFTASAAALLQLYPTWYMASALNVDAVAVGFGVGSCLLLLPQTPTTSRLALAALLTALAAWTKQVEVPLVVAQVGWLWVGRGRRTAVTFAIAYSAAMLVITGTVFSLLSPRDVIFNAWTIPAHHAFIGGGRAAWGELVDLGRYGFLLWAPCVGVLAFALRKKSVAAPGRDSPVGGIGLLLVAALVLLPTGIMATIKIGGDRNSLHSVYYLIAAATLVLGGNWLPAFPRRETMIAGFSLLVAMILTARSVQQVNGYPTQSMLPPRCVSQENWLFAREHPGRVYFPWDPLATLMAEGKMYHFEYGVYDRTSAGHPPAIERLRLDLPKNLETVIYPKADYSRTMLQALPNYSLSATTDDWLVYRAAPAARP